jgi:dipeptidyl aminopeptidase/acylaminoacyl peptidase
LEEGDAMPGTAVHANWFTYFPQDYRWSAAVVGTLSSAPWGGADIGEVDAVGRRLKKDVGNDDLWFREWVKMGDKVRTLALTEEQNRHPLSAAYHYQRACMYYQMGERFRTPKDRKANNAYRKALDCFAHFVRLTDRPRIEHVEVPFENGGSLPGLLVHAANTAKRKPPAVVFFDGLDVTKEIQYMRGVADIVRRGMSCLVMDGPGTGEAIRFRNYYLRYDYEVAGSAALDYLATRRDVNANQVGVMAISLGGYYAPRIASMDHRFKACVAWGAIWDYHATWKKRIAASMQADMSVPGHHIMWILNAKTLDDALQRLENFRLDGVVQQMRCPFLLTHGAEDRQVPVKDARALFNAVGSTDKTFKLFTAKEGGSQHCQRDNLSLGVTYIGDWLQEKLAT